MSLITLDTTALLAKAIAALPEQTFLHEISRGDALTDAEISDICAGELDTAIDDRLSDDSGSIDTYLAECLPLTLEREALRNSDEYSAFAEVCRERNESDPIWGLVRETGRKLVRFYVRDANGERVAMSDGLRHRWNDEEADKEARRLCNVCGLDFSANRDAFLEMIRNAHYGGVLCVLAYLDIAHVAKMVDHCLRNEDRNRVRVTFTDPHLCLLDHWNGSGHDAQVRGNVSIRFGRPALDRSHGVMALDAGGVGTGYGWNKIACPSLTFYRADPAVHRYTVRTGVKPDVCPRYEWPGR